MTKEKMQQNAEERLELLHTITEIVNMEVDKRMDILTAQKQQTAPRGKCPLGRKLRAFVSRFRIRNNQKNNSITLSRGYTTGAEARDTNKLSCHEKKLLFICALLVSVITLSGAANRSFRTEMEQWNPIGFTQAPSGTQITHNRSAILPTVATEAPSGVLRGGSTNVITFTTAKAVDRTISLRLDYTGSLSISGLTGTPVSGADVTYTITEQTVTITGDVTRFECRYNQLTVLDVSKNTALKELSCNYNELTALDVSKNTALEELSCNNNELTALDLSQNTALTTLYCGGNKLPTLDLSQNTALTMFSSLGNKLTALDVSKNTALTWLECGRNQLNALDVSKNTALTRLECGRNQLTALNLAKNSALEKIDCGDNQLTALDLSQNTALKELWCSDNQLTALDVSTNSALTKLSCTNNQLTALDVSPNTALAYLNCSNNQLKALDVSKNTALSQLSCYGNRIKGGEMARLVNSLPDRTDKSGGTFTVIQSPLSDGNRCLTTDVAIAKGKNWRTRKFNTDFLTGYDYEGEKSSILFKTEKATGETVKLMMKYTGDAPTLSGMTGTPESGTEVIYTLTSQYVTITGEVTSLNCSENQITELNISQNTALEGLICGSNQLTALDVSQNTALTNLDCAGNQIKGGEMTRLVNSLPDRTGMDAGEFTVVQEPALEGNNCIKSDVAIAKSKNWNTQKYKSDTNEYVAYEGEEPSSYVISFTTAKAVGKTVTLRLDYTGVAPTLSGLTGTPESGTEVIYTLTSQYVTITGNVTYFDCFENQITSLDVSKNTALTELYCGTNQLTELDVSQNTALTELNCYNNQLKALDVSQNTALRFLFCVENQLTALDVSQNTALTELGCSNNQLTALDVSQNTALTELSCDNNQLTALDISKNTALTVLDCFTNQLTALDVSKNTALTQLICSINQLTTLDVSKNTALTELFCGTNQLKALDVSKNTALTDLSCHSNQLTALDVSQNTALIWLSCCNNQLKALDVSQNTALTEFYCGNNQLTSLDLSQNGALNDFDCTGNQIKGEEMTRLVNSLPDRMGMDAGEFTVVQEPALEGNICLKSDVAIAKSKNWNTQKYNSDTEEYVAYEGAEEAQPLKVTLTKEGEGTISAIGADDLNAVPLGTELTIVATPADGYTLEALTANGTDILATKKFTVTADTEVKATFANKTAADVVDAGMLRLYPNPTSTYVNVKAAKTDALVRLYDANGTLRYEARTDADGTLQIDLSAYAEGIYLLRVGSDAQRLLIRR